MSISYPLTLPFSTRNAARIVFRQRSTVGVSKSPFTGEQQVYAHQGEWFEADIQLAPMERADAEEWVGALVSLNGQEGTFLLGDRANLTARGTWSASSPLVNGSHASGVKTMTVRGVDDKTWKRGDWLQLGSGSSARLHKIVQDGSQSGSPSVGTIEIWPRTRTTYADAAAITVASAVGVFRLAGNRFQWDIDEARFYGLSFSAVEAL